MRKDGRPYQLKSEDVNKMFTSLCFSENTYPPTPHVKAITNLVGSLGMCMCVSLVSGIVQDELPSPKLEVSKLRFVVWVRSVEKCSSSNGRNARVGCSYECPILGATEPRT